MTTHSNCHKKNVNHNKTNVHDFHSACAEATLNKWLGVGWVLHKVVCRYLPSKEYSINANKQHKPNELNEWINEPTNDGKVSLAIQKNWPSKFMQIYNSSTFSAKQRAEKNDWNIYNIGHDPMPFYDNLTLVNRTIMLEHIHTHTYNGRQHKPWK